MVDHVDVGLTSRSRSRAATFARPMLAGAWMIWRWRLEVDLVVVDDTNRADAGGRQVHRQRRTETPSANHQDFRVEQLALTDRADLGRMMWRA